MNMKEIAIKAKEASIKLSAISGELKNKALENIVTKLGERKNEIVEANKEDLQRSEKENLAAPLLKRLKFDESKINDVIEGIKSLIGLPDPVGETLSSAELDEGLELYRVTCPIGVMGIIFESRPDALVQISTLCLKSGNSVLLKGGSEARETNRILTKIIDEATIEAGMPEGWINQIETRSDVSEMLKMDGYIDLIIPRGSNEFVRHIMNNSRIPVMGHADGICHCYVEEDADMDMAVRIVTDSKTQYVAVCNAAETLLVNEKIARDFLPALKAELDKKDVELRGCEKVQEIVDAKAATMDDWATEYLDYILSVKIVKDLDEAIYHINSYGSGHTDAIITKDRNKAARFMSLVDSGNVFWNCSTRFSDGFRYGFGAEVGISTSKIHARGPVGLDGLIIYKYKLIGNGQIVDDYSKHVRTFKHKKIDKDFPM